MGHKKIELSGWQMIGIAVGLLVLAIACCSLGLLVGGAAGFSVGRATARAEAIPEERFILPPGVPTPERFPPGIAPSPEERPYLGIRYITRPQGAEIQEVIPNSPAERAGLKVGDLVREVDGQRVSTARPLVELLYLYRPGDRVVLTVEREGREIEIPVTLGRWPSP
jgi:membrane-associated protease RseP (regulator of RpoE activity)